MPIHETSAPTPPGEGKEIDIRVARSLPEVEALREPWKAWPGHRDSDIDFYLMILQSYPEVVRPHVIALYRDGKPVAILVGRLERKRLSFGVGYYLPVFRPWARCLTFVYGAIHGDASPQNTDLLVRAVLNCLKQGEADLALFESVLLDSPLYQFSLQVPGILSRDTYPPSEGHDSMVVPGSIDEVYRRMSSNRRIKLRSRVRKLQENPAGTPRIVCYRTISKLDRLFADAEEIARKTYQRGLAAGFGDNPRVRKRLELGARKGWLRAYLLYLGNRPCAFWIGMLYDGTFVGEYTGYDPEFRQWSPGMVLIMRVIEGFCSRANGDIVTELDFGPGHAEYKAALCSKYWQEASVFIFSPTVKGLLLKLMRATTRVAEGIARRILASTKFLPRLKRAWRDRLAKRGKPMVHVPSPSLPPEVDGWRAEPEGFEPALGSTPHCRQATAGTKESSGSPAR